VEDMLGWLPKCRAILARYEKKAANYLGLIKVARVLLQYQRQHRLSLAVQLPTHNEFSIISLASSRNHLRLESLD
jgi:hypothetical protein